MSNKLQAFFKSYSDSEKQLDFKMADETVGELSVISTGSLVLDDALSSGGIPKGRLVQYYGKTGSGKTLLAMIAIKSAQAADPLAMQLFIDAEQTFSPEWAEVLGLDTSRIIIVDGDMAVNGRKCFEMLLGVPKEDAKTHILKGKSKEGFLDKVISKEINCNMIVLDSLGSIIPPGEDVSAVGKMNMALLSRFLTTTFRKLSLEMSKVDCAFIIINHTKANMDSYGSDHTFSGGNSYAHFLSANIYFDTVNRADAKVLDENEDKIGSTIRGTIEKSKFGPWPRKCEFKVDFGIGIIDSYEEVAQLAISYDVITKLTPTSHSYNYKDLTWVGFNKLSDELKSNQDLCKELALEIAKARESKLGAKREANLQKRLSNATVVFKEPDLTETSSDVLDDDAPKKRGRKPKDVE